MSFCTKRARASGQVVLLEGIEFASMNGGVAFLRTKECGFPACRLKGGWKMACENSEWRDRFSATAEIKDCLSPFVRSLRKITRHRFPMVVLVDTVSPTRCARATPKR